MQKYYGYNCAITWIITESLNITNKFKNKQKLFIIGEIMEWYLILIDSLKTRIKRFQPVETILIAFAMLFIGFFIMSWWPRSFEKLKWLWLIIGVLLAAYPVYTFCSPITIIEKVKK